MLNCTLVYCLKDNYILLGKKKRGFAEGKINGYGGKVQEGESFEEAAVRELFEESKIKASVKDLEKVAVLDYFFTDVPPEKNWDQKVHVYILRKWEGIATETEEMRPGWYKMDKLPSEQMWSDDPFWLHMVFEGKKIIGSFYFVNKGKDVEKHEVKVVEKL